MKRKKVFVPAKKGGKSARFETQQPCVTVRLNLDGQELRLLVDSGVARLLLYRKRLKARFDRLEPIRVENDPSLVAAAGKIRAAWYRTSRVTLGNDIIGPQILLVVDADSGLNDTFDGLLGRAQTGFRRVWLHFENGLLAWE